MKEFSIEQKAKHYDEAIDKISDAVEAGTIEQGLAEWLFPELKENENEQSKKWILEYLYDGLRKADEQFKDQFKAAIAWLENQGEKLNNVYDKELSEILGRIIRRYINNPNIPYTKREKVSREIIPYVEKLEKQGDNCLVNFDEAEQEKYDFVSGQYLQCRASFNEFKEYNSYWFEYIGNDTYIGRSDNILNKKFHITPRQLFTLFTQEHDYYCPKEDNTNAETNAPIEYGKDEHKPVWSEKDEGIRNFLISKMEEVGNVWKEYSAKDIIAWLEKHGELSIYNVPSREVILAIWDLGNEWKELTNYCISTEYGTQLDYIQKHWKESEYYLREKKSGQKPVNKTEPKFHKGEWVINQIGHIRQIIDIKNDCYYCNINKDDNDTISWKLPIEFADTYWRKWTIQNAKDGDTLVNGSNIFIFHFLNDTRLMGYCHINTDDGKFYDDLGKNECFCLIDAVVIPATKEQRDLLFGKMEEAGYEWDTEKKELKKTYIIDEGKDEIDYCFTKMMKGEKVIPAWSEEDEGKF